MKHYDLIDWLSSNCPIFFSLLNKKAKSGLPTGIKDYLSSGSDDEIESGKSNFLTIENHLSELIEYSSEKEVRDTYRRDLSNVSTEQTLSEIFCELALCVKVGSYSSSVTLRPSTEKGTHSDCKLYIDGCEIFGEVKRYQDSWPHIVEKKEEEENYTIPFGRSIFKSKPEENPMVSHGQDIWISRVNLRTFTDSFLITPLIYYLSFFLHLVNLKNI